MRVCTINAHRLYSQIYSDGCIYELGASDFEELSQIQPRSFKFSATAAQPSAGALDFA